MRRKWWELGFFYPGDSVALFVVRDVERELVRRTFEERRKCCATRCCGRSMRPLLVLMAMLVQSSGQKMMERRRIESACRAYV